MLIHYVKGVIERNPMTHIPVLVPATEVPVLQMVHGGSLSGLAVTDETADIDPEAEFERIKASYGDREGGRSFAEEVYGSAHGMARQMGAFAIVDEADDGDDEPARPAARRGRAKPAPVDDAADEG